MPTTNIAIKAFILYQLSSFYVALVSGRNSILGLVTNVTLTCCTDEKDERII